MIKKTVLALAMFGVSSLALAQGAYDGVYQPAGAGGYMVILQNGQTLGVAALGYYNNTAKTQLNVQGSGNVVPDKINTWVVATGTIVGNTATVSGLTDYGACTSLETVAFDGAGNMTLTVLSSAPTALGQSSGYNCTAAVGTKVTSPRVF